VGKEVLFVIDFLPLFNASYIAMRHNFLSFVPFLDKQHEGVKKKPHRLKADGGQE
jgi:hypothetical protein